MISRFCEFDIIVVCAIRRCANHAHGMSELCEKHGKIIRDVRVKQLKNGRNMIGNMRSFAEKNYGLAWMLCTQFLENWDIFHIFKDILEIEHSAIKTGGNVVENFKNMMLEDKIYPTLLFLLEMKGVFPNEAFTIKMQNSWDEIIDFCKKNRLRNVFLVSKDTQRYPINHSLPEGMQCL